jgi:hypothetical protein
LLPAAGVVAAIPRARSSQAKMRESLSTGDTMIETRLGPNILLGFLFVLIVTTSARAEPSIFSGNTIVCTNSSNPQFPSVRTLYFSKQRIFVYDAVGRHASSAGIVYNIDGQHSGHGSGDLTYESSSRVNSRTIELSATVSQTCGICDGHRMTVSEKFLVSSQGDHWSAVRTYRQSFSDGARAAVPGGSESYSCKIVKGRHGVGR